MLGFEICRNNDVNTQSGSHIRLYQSGIEGQRIAYKQANLWSFFILENSRFFSYATKGVYGFQSEIAEMDR